MKLLSKTEEAMAVLYFQKARDIATQSSCERSHCGSVIVKNDEIIGIGTNSPPDNQESQRRCLRDKERYDTKVTDKTCCIHAEQRAILDALKHNHEKIAGSKIYFIRLDEQGNMSRAGKPYCTLCSKLALEVGIAEFILWHKEGIAVYTCDEYNLLSFEYKKEMPCPSK